MLYTRKGDRGKTGTFGCDQRVSKSSKIAEALGTLDEINSYLGLCKIKAKKQGLVIFGGDSLASLIGDVQKDLFIIQAEIAGSEKTMTSEKVTSLEIVIDWAEKELPPIKSFFISGGTKLAAMFDFARTLARRAERRVVEVMEEGKTKVGENTLAYLNRLSSLLYALARLANHVSGITEDSPDYK